MICKIDSISLLSVRSKDYDGKKYYFVSIFENGFVSSCGCSKEFYDAHVGETRSANAPVVLKSVGAEIYFVKGATKVKLL